MTHYAIEPYRPELLQQVVRLESPFWGSSAARGAAFFDWKYQRNPYTPEPLFYVALREGRVVGARGMFGSCWEVDGSGEPVVLPVAADLMIDPAHRDSDLFLAINDFSRADLERRGYTHLLNTSSSTANAIASVVTMGWRAVDAVGELARRKPAAARAARLLSNASRPALGRRVMALARRARGALRIAAFRSLDRNTRREPAELGYPISVTREPRVEAMAGLVEQIGSDGRIRHVRDAAYFNWKFDNPLADYRFLYWGERDLEGYLVLQYQRTMSQVNILDWEARDPNVRLGLLLAAVKWGGFWNLHVWSGTLGDADRAVLREAGFSPSAFARLTARHGGNLLMRPVGSAAEDESWCLRGRRIDRADEWDLRMLYSDMV